MGEGPGVRSGFGEVFLWGDLRYRRRLGGRREAARIRQMADSAARRAYLP